MSDFVKDTKQSIYYKKWYRENRDKRLEYFLENAEYYRKYSRKWKKANPAKVKLQRKRRYERLMNNE